MAALAVPIALRGSMGVQRVCGVEQERRTTIIGLYRAGHSPTAIQHLLKYPKSTIYAVINRFKTTGATTGKQGKDRKPRSDKILNQKFLTKLKREIKKDPSVNQAVHARKMGVSHTTIGKGVKMLGMKSRSMNLKHLITERQAVQRVIKSKRILNSLKNVGKKSGAKPLQFFSDEKIFTLNRHRNSKLDRWICEEPHQVKTIMKAKNPAGIMVLSVISNQGHVMDPHFFYPQTKGE